MKPILGFIAILLFLAALASFAVFKVIGHHPPHYRIEIEQLAQTIVGYKQDRIQYPPCLADTDPQVRKVRLLRHLNLAYANTNYGTNAEAYDVLNARVQTEWKYNFLRRDGTLAPLDLDRLDAAESLVFWLGGFPTPYLEANKQPIAGRKLFGFHSDDDDPFKRDPPDKEQPQPLRSRTDPRYPFEETRLVDHDDDGWLEYTYMPQRNSEAAAPFVYFDAETYTAASLERAQWGSCFYPQDSLLAAKWGTASPYMVNINPRPIESITWAKSAGFQIICASLDGKYGPVGDGKTLPPRRFTAFVETPHTFTAADDFQQPHELDDAEFDNLTNLSSKPIGAGVQKN